MGQNQTPTRMNAFQSAMLVASAAAVLSLTGCDPGYTYRPVGPQGNRLAQWSQTVEGVRFSGKPYATLIGSSYAIVSLDIANDSKKKVVVLDGQLESKGRTIKAKVDDSPEEQEARTVPPGETKKVDLFWDMGGAASDVLGPEITWVWRVRIGKDEHTLRVTMQRQR